MTEKVTGDCPYCGSPLTSNAECNFALCEICKFSSKLTAITTYAFRRTIQQNKTGIPAMFWNEGAVNQTYGFLREVVDGKFIDEGDIQWDHCKTLTS